MRIHHGANYQLTCLNCNIENYSTDGIRLKSNGTAYIANSTFLATDANTSPTYNSHLTIDYSTRMIQLVSCGFISLGAKLAPGRLGGTYSPHGAPLRLVDCSGGDSAVDCIYHNGNVVVNPATETVAANEAATPERVRPMPTC